MNAEDEGRVWREGGMTPLERSVRMAMTAILWAVAAAPVSGHDGAIGLRGSERGAEFPAQQAPVRVVASLPVYADVVRQIGGAEVHVTSIAHPREDAHFVRPKPSFARELRDADLFITTGLDLELWVPTLLDKAGNSRVSEGGPGYVTAYTGIALLDIPAGADRSAGDVHLYGNPHLHTDPLRVVQIARNVTVGLKRVAPERAELWDAGLANFTERLRRALFGDALVDLFGGETLDRWPGRGGCSRSWRTTSTRGYPSSSDSMAGWAGRPRSAVIA